MTQASRHILGHHFYYVHHLYTIAYGGETIVVKYLCVIRVVNINNSYDFIIHVLNDNHSCMICCIGTLILFFINNGATSGIIKSFSNQLLYYYVATLCCIVNK